MFNKLIAGLFLVAAPFMATAQTSTSKSSTNTTATVLTGKTSLSAIAADANYPWMAEGFAAYTPQANPQWVVNQKISQYKMVVFLGTWCADSRTMIPQLYKVVKEAGMPEAQITVYATDRNKTVPGGIEKKYRITNVPTIILFDGDKEMGRITETVKINVENDLLNIIEHYQTGK